LTGIGLQSCIPLSQTFYKCEFRARYVRITGQKHFSIYAPRLPSTGTGFSKIVLDDVILQIEPAPLAL